MGVEPYWTAGELVRSWGGWVQGLGRWDLFGGLTMDQRRGSGTRYTAPAFDQVPEAERAGWLPGPTVGLGQAPRLTDMQPPVRAGGRVLARDVAVARVLFFLREGQRQLGRQIEAGIVALEYQKNGWPHFHPLLRIEGGLLGGEIAVLGPLWWRLSGGNRLSVPRSVKEVAAYACKYLAKGLDRGEVVIWPQKGPLRPAGSRQPLPRGRGARGRAGKG